MNGFKWFVASLFGIDGYIKMLENKSDSYERDVTDLEEQVKMIINAHQVEKDSLSKRIGELELGLLNVQAENQQMAEKMAERAAMDAKKRKYKADKQREYRRRRRERKQGRRERKQDKAQG